MNFKSDQAERTFVLKFWLLFSAAFMTVSFFVSYFGLFGSWTVTVFDTPYYYNWDPDGFYLGSGIAFFDNRYVSFVGHPGLPLMFLIAAISRVYYLTAMMFGAFVPFPVFVSKNIFWIILLTKLGVTAVHLLSFYALYRISRIFLNEVVSVISVLSYATTAVVLYYMDKISPEPFIVLFTFLSVLWIWQYRQNRRRRREYIYLALSALACAAAICTKMMISAPLPVFIFIYVVCQSGVTFRKKAADGILFLCLSGLFLVVFGWKVDWTYYFQFWFQYGPDVTSGMRQDPALVKFFYMVSKIFLPSQRVPGFSSQKAQFNLGEYPFMLLSIVGFFMYWRSHHEKRGQLLWLTLLIVMISPSVLFNGSYHYFVVHLAFAAIFFSYLMYRAVDRMFRNRVCLKYKILTACLITLIIHSFNMAIFIEAKKSNITQYQKWWKPYYDALKEISYDERIGLVNTPDYLTMPDTLISYYIPPSSIFYKEFNRFFVRVDSGDGDNVMKDGTVSIVLERRPQGIVTKRVIEGRLQGGL